MKNYFIKNYNKNEFNSVSVIDELPLWSAPFGLRLLETIKYRKGINVLDIGCGTGFPFIELAQRLGNSCNVYGIDEWENIIKRAELKKRVYGLKNTFSVTASAEYMPFKNNYFDLIVSNNGINNVGDLKKTLSECSRVCRRDAQFAFTFNLEQTMIEFYDVFEKILSDKGLYIEIKKMKEQIYQKRKPVIEIINLLENSGFVINAVTEDYFRLRFTDAEAMLNHSLIKNWFLEGWEKIVDRNIMDDVFSQIEIRMNENAGIKEGIYLGIPFAVIDAVKN